MMDIDFSLLDRLSVFGKMRSGKDTVALYLKAMGNYKRFAFGDALKEHYHALFGFNGKGKDRKGYQTFGQMMRQIDPEVWIKKLDRNMRPELGRSRVVITDMRQPNEYKYLKSLGFVMVKVECPDEIRLERMRAAGDNFDESDLNHETEQYIDGFEYDIVIDNSGDMIDLYLNLAKAFTEWSGRYVH